MENVKTLYNHIVEVEDRLNAHLKNAGGSESAIRTLQNEVQGIKSTNQTQTQNIAQNASQIQENQTSIQNLISGLSSANSAINTNTNSISNLNTSFNTLSTEVQDCEKTNNKTTALSQNSTDVEYPSARCVYNAIPQMINATGTSTKDGMTQNSITYNLGLKVNTSTYQSAGGNINASSWKTALGINNVANLKITYGTDVYAGGNPMTVETGLTTVYSFVAMVCRNTADVIPPCFCLLHKISGSKAYFSMRLTSSGALVPANQNSFYWIAVGV